MADIPKAIDDRSLKPLQVPPVCAYCKHFKRNEYLETHNHRTPIKRCTAFPTKIPKTIWTAQDLHKEPYPGDRGIQFEPAPNVVLPDYLM